MKAVVALLALLAAPVAAQDLTPLEGPGVAALMRHAIASGTSDPEAFEIDDCATQRTLSDTGEEQARKIARTLHEAGIEFDQVWSSLWCRAFSTAELLDVGEVVPFPPLNSFFDGRGDRARQTRDVLQALDKLDEDARVLLVTHQVNITELTGIFPGSGEIIGARRTEDGLEVVGRVAIGP
ncbi:histidine phosphatase family protein [Palleronia sp.]|uniref:SixA phosphatase family protein n=1 Tax=Palleronia sp. TaxID=1940284 RepID=UPI0035C86F50